MKSEFTAIIEPAPEGGYWAICPEIPGANGQDHKKLDAGHFIQEDRYQELAEIIIGFHKRYGKEV